MTFSFDPPGEYRKSKATFIPNPSDADCKELIRDVYVNATREHAGLVITCKVIKPSNGAYDKNESTTLVVQECSAVRSNPVSHILWDVKGRGGEKGSPLLRQTNYSETHSKDSWFWDVISKASVEIREGETNFGVTCRIFYPDNATSFTDEHIRVFVIQGKNEELTGKIWMLAVVISNCLVVILVVILCCIALKKTIRKRRKKKRHSSSRSSEGDDSYPMVSLPFGNEERQGGTLRSEGTLDRVSKTFIPELEFPRTRVKLQEIIGNGNFGQVYKAIAKGIVRNGVDTTVAVKIIKGEKGSSVWSDFKNELSIFKNLKQHPYVVSILGCCTTAEPYYIIMEYIQNGTLQDYITQKRQAWGKAKMSGAESASKEALSAVHILMFAFEVANGMEYLSSMHLIHRDLATRNVLLGEGLVCKLCDFGMARDVTGSEQYEMLSGSAVPVRWLALECLLSNTYTTKSDVWSFGILLWELVTLGALPYAEMTPDAIIDAVRQGFRLPRPAHCGLAL
ncbi:fibroblast growth factor receptor-like [Patiria miniata]|uniref:Protein kinase domain-containing protein n=1 Tax=Patiria miniata TaxID=46514 RepID=A0A913ZVA2_PATMI|nr:fibroblast growth factor receptor-like [Patiria miniata]